MQQTGGHGQVAHIAFKEHLSAITRMQKSSFLQLYPLLTHSKPAKVSHFIMPGLSVAIACPFSRTPQSIKTFYHMVQPQFYKIHCSYPHTKNNKKKFKKFLFLYFDSAGKTHFVWGFKRVPKRWTHRKHCWSLQSTLFSFWQLNTSVWFSIVCSCKHSSWNLQATYLFNQIHVIIFSLSFRLARVTI